MTVPSRSFPCSSTFSPGPVLDHIETGPFFCTQLIDQSHSYQENGHVVARDIKQRSLSPKNTIQEGGFALRI